jgi:hypothetical protein
MHVSTRGTSPSIHGPHMADLVRMIKDERIRAEELRTIFDVKEAPNKLG